VVVDAGGQRGIDTGDITCETLNSDSGVGDAVEGIVGIVCVT